MRRVSELAKRLEPISRQARPIRHGQIIRRAAVLCNQGNRLRPDLSGGTEVFRLAGYASAETLAQVHCLVHLRGRGLLRRPDYHGAARSLTITSSHLLKYTICARTMLLGHG